MKFMYKLTLLGLLSNAQMYAMTGGNKLSGEGVPDWALGNASCSATLIAPRVVLTSAHCLTNDNNETGFYYRKTGTLLSGTTYKYNNYVTNDGSLHDVAIVYLDKSYNELNTISIPSYNLENTLLVDNNLTVPYNGTSKEGIGLYGQTRNNNLTYNYQTDAGYMNVYAKYLADDNYYVPSAYKLQYMSYNRIEQSSSLPALSESYKNLLINQKDMTIKDIDNQLIMIADWDNNNTHNIQIPISTGDAGGTIVYNKNGTSNLIGVISGTKSHTRLKNNWKWIIDKVSKLSKDDAYHIAKQVIGNAWGANDRKGKVGDIFVYNNPYSGDIEYFMLRRLGSDDRYWYFSTNKQDNYFWKYLGTSFPKPETFEIFNTYKRWGENDRKANIGDIFIYSNIYNGDIEFFKLKQLGSDNRYWYFPIDKKDNYFWEYLGTDIPKIKKIENNLLGSKILRSVDKSLSEEYANKIISKFKIKEGERNFAQTSFNDDNSTSSNESNQTSSNDNQTFAFKVVKITYKTKDEQDKDVNASGVLLYPIATDEQKELYKEKTGKEYSISLVVLNHGTIFLNAKSPSIKMQDLNATIDNAKLQATIGMSLLMASKAGFAVALPDYLGYGDSNAVDHPYMLKKSSARVSMDMLKASSRYMTNKKLPFKNDIYLNGYSEGGYVTMAMAQEAEKKISGYNFNFKGIAPMAGPYNVTSLAKKEIENTSNMIYPAFIGYFTQSYTKAYNNLSLADTIVMTDTDTFNKLFDGSKDAIQIHKALGLTNLAQRDFGFSSHKPSEFFKQTFIDNFTNNYSTNNFKLRLDQNNIDDWNSTIKMNLIQCKADEIIPFSITQSTYNNLSDNNSSDITLSAIDTNQIYKSSSPFTHANCETKAYRDAVVWFDKIRSGNIK